MVQLGGGGSVLARTTFLHMLIRLGLKFSWADKTCAPEIFARNCEILNFFLIISGSHLGLSLKYHIPAFVNT